MTVPVVVEARFQLEPLAGETPVEHGGAGDRRDDRMGAAEGQPYRLPHHRLGVVRHHDGALQLVGMNVPDYRRRAGIGDDGERAVVEPHIFAPEHAGAVVFGDDVAGEVVDVMQRGAAARYRRYACFSCGLIAQSG